jgi:outer membrane protein assembly factor BamB
MTTTIVRIAIAVLFAAQFVIFEWAVLARGRFSAVPGGRVLVVIVGAVVYVAAIAFLVARAPRWRTPGVLAVVAAFLFTARFHLPLILDSMNKPKVSPDLVAFLRELSAAQEQYRLSERTYASSIDSLRKWTIAPAASSVRIERHGGAGWSGRVTLGSAECVVWVRDSTLRGEAWHPEGSPTCGQGQPRAHQIVRSIVATSANETGFAESDVSGAWLQHRVDERRSGTIPRANSRFRWSTTIGGELRAAVAVAGNQVFIGAHGNGELVALSLDSGQVGFRLRAPNWVHHEPAVTSTFVIVGFGNSESIFPGGPVIGSAPSGIAVYDRRTGVERWRRYTNGAVMASPVVRDSIVAVITYAGDAVAWRIADGAELWRTRLNRMSPMANPLIHDTVMFVGVELAGLCALDVRTGRSLYCRDFAENAWGSGHASPTLAGNSVLLAYHARDRRFWLKALAGFSEPTSRGEAMLASLDAATGRERWHAKLGRGIHDVIGHIAGTPVVSDDVAYVPVPSSGRVVAVHIDSGRVLWSTEVSPARGSVLVTQSAVLSASADGEFVVLDAGTGIVRCRQKLPARPDRAGLTLAGETGILTLRNGLVLARPIGDWLACRA